MYPDKQFWIMFAIAMVIYASLISCCHAQELTASWYSVESLRREGTTKYSHNVMANGQVFNESVLTCATRDYPLGAMLRITNITNGKSVIVKVTDRINKRFKGKRIDLSRSAFLALDKLNKGIIRVKVEMIENVAKKGI